MGDWFQEEIVAVFETRLTMLEWLLVSAAAWLWIRFYNWIERVSPWSRLNYQPPAVPWWKTIPRHRR